MPRGELLTSSERLELLAFPTDEGELIRLYTLTKADLAFGRQHRGDHNRLGIAVLMSVICVILLSVTGAGIVGLSSLWVGQRTRQIGVRRAIGARKIDILRYFQIENLLIAGGGAVVGSLATFLAVRKMLTELG